MAETTGSRVVSARVHVLGSWFVSHVVATLALVLTPDITDSGLRSLAFYRGLYRKRLTFMDGGWYRLIVNHGYPNQVSPHVANEWPFFPLYPWLAGALRVIGPHTRLSLILVSWIAALVAGWGVWKLAESRFGTETAAWSVWLFVFAPGAIGLTMAYSDGIFVAGVVWALVFADRIVTANTDDPSSTATFDRRFLAVGLCCLVATMSRPNGFLVVFALAWSALASSHRVRSTVAVVGPSLVFLVCWMAYARHMTGDALAFLTSKNAWLETMFVDFVRDPFERPAIVFHVIVLVVTVAIAWPAVRRLPMHWVLVAGLLVVPSFILGVEGLARYTFMAVPLSIAMAVRLVDRSRAWRVGVLLVSGAALVFLCANVVRYTWVP